MATSISAEPGSVFVSSTCSDLIDLRAEIAAHIRQLGLIPRLSDSDDSEFRVSGRHDAIGTCLANIASSQVVVVVLSGRYGSLVPPEYGESISVTHLEYRTAVEQKKAVLLYVRDRLWGEFELRQRLPRAPLQWIRSPDDERLFEVILEHTAGRGYRSVFRDSTDLRRLLSKDLGLQSQEMILLQLRERNEIGEMLAQVETRSIEVRFRVTHTGARLADCSVTIGPGQTLWNKAIFDGTTDLIEIPGTTVAWITKMHRDGDRRVLEFLGTTISGHKVGWACRILDTNGVVTFGRGSWFVRQVRTVNEPLKYGEKGGYWVQSPELPEPVPSSSS